MGSVQVEGVRALIAEGLKPIHEIAELRSYSHDSLVSWIRVGRRSLDGTRVRLEAVRHPKCWRTSDAAVARFFARLAGDTVATDAA